MEQTPANDPGREVDADGYVKLTLIIGNVAQIVKHDFNEIETYHETETGLFFRFYPESEDVGNVMLTYPWSSILYYQIQCNSPKVAEEIQVKRANWEIDNLRITPPEGM